MKTWNWAIKCLGMVAVMGMASSVWAQAGAGGAAGGATGASATGAGATGAAGAAGATTPAGGGGTIWNFFGINKAGLKECKVKLCKSPIGMLLGNTMKPMSAMTGGLIPSCCPKVLNEDALAKAAKEGPEKAKGDAQAAAADIAKDEAEAKERRAAVRYLGTVDCHYWKDKAQPALINALRNDRNECVRWEAAMALGNGCCCTMDTIESLTISVYGVYDPIQKLTVAGALSDGYPDETSERVKAAALAALQHCLSCYSKTVAPGPEKRLPGRESREPVPENIGKAGDKAPATFQPTSLSKPVQAKTMAQVIENARQMTMTPTTVGYSTVPESKHTVSGVFSKAFGPSSRPGDVPAEGAVMSAPPPRYSGLLPWLTR